MSADPAYVLTRLAELTEFPVFQLDVGPDGTVQGANDYTLRLLGKDPRGKEFRSVLVDFDQSLDLQAMAREEPRRKLFNIHTLTGLPQSIYCDVFFLKDGAVRFLGAMDPEEQETIRRQVVELNQQMGALARELQKSNVELARLNDLKSKFLGIAAHDLRKPAGVIQSFGEFILEETEMALPEEHRGFLLRIVRNAKFMRRLIDDFLDVALIEQGRLPIKPTPISLGEILEHVQEIVEVHARRKKVPLEIARDADEVGMQADGQKLEQVFINLISNAIEHSHEGDPIIVRWSETLETITVEIEDHGVGIPPEKQKRLFNPYERGVSPKTGGEPSTGLGLVIARKVIEAHGGELTLESEVGVGSTFTIQLPRRAQRSG